MITELSILIPVFNLDVRPLVQELHRQCSELAIRYEILLFDDASEERYRTLNRELGGLPFVHYRELRANIGRAAIRNSLALEAVFNYLLMLDNDCMPAGKNFIAHYLEQTTDADVVVGGVAYATQVPEKKYRLHWKYGQRAAKPASERQKEPYKHIFLSNVLLKREVFMRFQLYESLKEYGHEDTVFALKLERQGVRVKQIQNPVVHLGLEPTKVFLAKTEQAIGNLAQLYAKGEQLDSLKLIKAYQFLESKGMSSGFIALFKIVRPLVVLNLKSASPGMFLFDLYRLFLFAGKMKKGA